MKPSLFQKRNPAGACDPQVVASRLACIGLFTLWAAVAPGQLHAQSETEGRTLIKAQHIYTVDGDVISPGQVLVTDGKVTFVGSSIELSLPARVMEVEALMPGLVNVASRAGIAGGQAEVSREVAPDFDALNAVDFDSRDFAEAVDEGVTTVQILPDTDSVICGFASVVKTAGEPVRRVVKERQAMVIAVCSDPTSRNRSRSRPDSIYVRQPTNRMGVMWILRNALHQTRQGEAAIGLEPSTREILATVLDHSMPVLSVSRTDFDIRSSLELGNEFGFLPTIYGGDEVYRMIDEFAESGASLVYTGLTTSATTRGLRGAEGTELRWNVPGKLQESGVTFCLAGDNLLDQARFAVRYGLKPEEALGAVTLMPAKLLGMDSTVGSITVGKSADLVALSGDPLQPTSAVLWTMIGGEMVGGELVGEGDK